VLERPIRARAVTERDRQLARQQRRENLESGAGAVRVENENGRERMSVGGRGLPPEQIERMMAGLEFAPTVPVITGIRADAEGRLWVQREGGPGEEGGPIDLIGPDGQYLGTIRGATLPDAFAAGGLAAWIRSDDLGVQRVAVSRVVMPR
jgi:hypothetical protein